MRFTLKQLETFAAIARQGNVSRAAEELCMSQSAASMALGDLEKQLGFQLFYRSGKKLLLNEAGHMLVPRVMELLSRADEIEQLARGRNSWLGSSLRIGASTTIGNYLLPDLLGDFVRQQPHCKVSLDVDNTEGVIQQILQFSIDVGFIEGPCHRREVVVMPWRLDELVVFAAASHPLVQLPVVTLTDLQGADWILREPGSGTREVFDRATLGQFDKVNRVIEVGHTEAIKRTVASGLGISCLSRDVLQDAFARGDLVPLATPYLNLTRQLFVLLHEQKYVNDTLRRFLDMVGYGASPLPGPG